MPVKLPKESVWSVLLGAIEAVKNKTDEASSEWMDRTTALSEALDGRSQTVIAFLGTSLLAKSVNLDIDPFSVKTKSGTPGAYAARPVARILALGTRQRGIDIGASKDDPLANQPFFHLASVNDGFTDVEALANAQALLLEALDKIDGFESLNNARAALRGYLAARPVRADDGAIKQAVSKPAPPKASPVVAQNIPLNLILYGPPGTGKTYTVQKEFVPRLVGDNQDNVVTLTFHQSYTYEDFIEGIRPRLSTEADSQVQFEMSDGVFKIACDAAARAAGLADVAAACALTRQERNEVWKGAPAFVVVIDEINRANVSRVLGELITLLEDDRRLGESSEVIVTLPYSGKRFGVPPNLYVIGTMNTADRSVEALDVALRRRFSFHEIGPRAEVLAGTIVDGVKVDRLLSTINARIRTLYDRDHEIGHTYFLPLRSDPSLSNLKRIFADKVIPLLQEYFFSDWAKLGLVLGSKFVVSRPTATFASFDSDLADQFSEDSDYALVEVGSLDASAFMSIYDATSSDPSSI